MNDIDQELKQRGVLYTPNGNVRTMQCPFCWRVDSQSRPMGTFNIDIKTGRGECGECHKFAEKGEWLDALDKPEIESKETDNKTVKEARNFQEIPAVNFKIVGVGEILATDFGPEVWAVQNLIPEQSITAIGGAPGSFKTWLTLDIARCIASGEDFLGKFKVEKGAVLFVDKENNFRHLQKRFRQIGINSEHPIYYLNQSAQDFFIEEDKSFKILKDMVAEKNIKLVVFDSLVRIHKGDENEARSISSVMNKFKQITNVGANVIFIHHHRKEPAGRRKSGNSLRGSSDILAGVDALLIVEKTDDEKSLTINQAKLRQDQALEPFEVSIQVNETDKAMKLLYTGAYDPNAPIVDEAVAEIGVILKEKGELSKKQIREIVSEEYKPNQIDMALKKATQPEGNIKVPIVGSNKHLYSLK